VPFLLLPILTRALNPVEYGNVVSFYILVAVCASLAGLGLHTAVGVRWLDPAKGDAARYTASAIVLVFASSAVAALVTAAVAPAVGIKLAPEVSALAAVVAGANVMQGMRFVVWQNRERPLPAAALQVISATVNIVLSLLAVFVLRLGGLGRILGATSAGVLTAVFCVISLSREQAATRPTATDIRALLRFGLPLMPHTLAAALLTSADRFAVSAQLGSGALGIYGAASQLGMIIPVLADAATKAYVPTMYRLLSRRSIWSRLRVVAITYLSVPGWILVAVVLWGVLLLAGPLLLGAQYLDAIGLAIWFLLGGAVGGIYMNIAGLFFFTGNTEWISVASVASSLLALLIATRAVSAFGLAGGGATYLAAQIALLAAAWALSRRVSPMPWHRPALALALLFREFPKRR